MLSLNPPPPQKKNKNWVFLGPLPSTTSSNEAFCPRSPMVTSHSYRPESENATLVNFGSLFSLTLSCPNKCTKVVWVPHQCFCLFHTRLSRSKNLLPSSTRPSLLQKNRCAGWDPKFRRRSWWRFQRGSKRCLGLQTTAERCLRERTGLKTLAC